MATKTTGFGVLALTFALTVATAVPASAEFFGCNDQQHRTSAYSTRSYTAPARRQHTGNYTLEFAAQSSRYATSLRQHDRSLSEKWR